MASILKNKGTSGIDAQVFTGRALSFDRASSQSIITERLGNLVDANFTILLNMRNSSLETNKALMWFGRYDLTIFDGRINVYNGTSYNYFISKSDVFLAIVCDNVNTYIYEDGILVHTFNDVVPRYINQVMEIGTRSAFNTFANADLSNLVILNEVLTPQQIADYHTTPHTFLYKTESGLASDSGLDTSKVVSWFPMTEDDGYVRDVANYSESAELVTNGTFDTDSDWGKGTNWSISGGVATSSGLNGDKLTQSIPFLQGDTVLVSLDVVATDGGNLRLYERDGAGGTLYPIDTDIEGTGTKTFIHTIKSDNPYLNVYDGLVVCSIDNVSVKELSSIYPITNYTTDMPQKGLNYGLQTAKLLLDDNGVVVGKSDYLESYIDCRVDTGWLPTNDYSWTIEWIQNKLNDNWVVNTGKSYYAGGAYTYNNKDFYFGHDGLGNFTLRMGDTSISIGNDEAMPINVDYLIAVSYNKDTNKLYMSINDNLYTKESNTNVTFVPSTYTLFLLEKHYEYLANVSRLTTPLKLFKVHNKVLTQEEITANYNDYVSKGLLND